MSQYPKWVQRAPEIGDVLVLDEVEHADLLASWEAHLMRAESDRITAIKAQAEADNADALSVEAERAEARPARRGK